MACRIIGGFWENQLGSQDDSRSERRCTMQFMHVSLSQARLSNSTYAFRYEIMLPDANKANSLDRIRKHQAATQPCHIPGDYHPKRLDPIFVTPRVSQNDHWIHRPRLPFGQRSSLLPLRLFLTD